MEITKIFSELGGEEKLYSVSLDETEMILFSEFQKEFAVKFDRNAMKFLNTKSKNLLAGGKDGIIEGAGAQVSRALKNNPGITSKRQDQLYQAGLNRIKRSGITADTQTVAKYQNNAFSPFGTSRPDLTLYK